MKDLVAEKLDFVVMSEAREIARCEKHGMSFSKGSECFLCMRERWKREDDEREMLLMAKQKEDEKLKAIALNKEKSCVPRCYRLKTWDDFHVHTDKQATAKATAKRFVSKFERDILPSGKALILTGTVGTGKSLLASIIANTLLDDNFEVLYTSAYNILLDIRDAMHFSASKSVKQVIEHYANVPLLIIDEVGMQFDTDSARRDFFEIINRRYENLLPIVLISNLSEVEIEHFITDRAISRLKERGVHCILDGEDYRKKDNKNNRG